MFVQNVIITCNGHHKVNDLKFCDNFSGDTLVELKAQLYSILCETNRFSGISNVFIVDQLTKIGPIRLYIACSKKNKKKTSNVFALFCNTNETSNLNDQLIFRSNKYVDGG